MLTNDQVIAREEAIEAFEDNGDWDTFIVALKEADLVENVADLDEINALLAESADVDRGIIY